MAMEKVGRFWRGVKRKLSGSREPSGGVSRTSVWLWVLASLFGLYLILALGLGIYWSMTPGLFEVQKHADQLLTQKDRSKAPGAVVAATQIAVVETLLNKSGGYISNDIAPPGLWLDNMPNWEYGVVIQVRDMSKAMREAFSRSQSQSLEDKDLALAESRFNFNTDSWLMPATENQYREGVSYVHNYFDRLTGAEGSRGGASFYARADSLRYWLSNVESRLGSLSQRLSASVGQRRLNTDLAAGGRLDVGETLVRTPWTEIDDVFFEARGSAWALIHYLKAAEIDFADVLEQKNAQVSLRQIIRELEASQQTVYSPMILNASGFGILANHSLVMGSYLSRAHAAMIDLRRLLDEG